MTASPAYPRPLYGSFLLLLSFLYNNSLVLTVFSCTSIAAMQISNALSLMLLGISCLNYSVSALPTAEQAAANNDAPPQYRSVGYFVNWAIYQRNFTPKNVVANQFSHLLYAFGDVHNDGEVVLSDLWADTGKHLDGEGWNDPNVNTNAYGCVKQIYEQKKANRKLKVLLSIGGWTWSSHFVAPASTPEGRQKFAETAVKLIANVGFDGLDIDWEYPQNDAEAQNLVSLLEVTRAVSY